MNPPRQYGRGKYGRNTYDHYRTIDIWVPIPIDPPVDIWVPIPGISDIWVPIQEPPTPW